MYSYLVFWFVLFSLAYDNLRFYICLRRLYLLPWFNFSRSSLLLRMTLLMFDRHFFSVNFRTFAIFPNMSVYTGEYNVSVIVSILAYHTILYKYKCKSQKVPRSKKLIHSTCVRLFKNKVLYIYYGNCIIKYTLFHYKCYLPLFPYL